jgi:hypothetical protein
MTFGARVEGVSDGRRSQRVPAPESGRQGTYRAAGGVHDPLHGDPLHPRRGRADGVLGELRRISLERVGRLVDVPQALRVPGADRPRRDVRRLAPRPQAGAPADSAAARRGLLPDGRGDGAWSRRDGERRDALARRRPAAVPAVGAPEAGAGALHGAGAGYAATHGGDAGRALQAAADRDRRCFPAADEAAGHGHVDGHLLHRRGAAGGGRDADAPPRHALRRARGDGDGAGRRGALPDGAPDGFHRPVRGRRGHGLPGGPGADGDRLGRALRSRPRRVGPEDLLPARGPHRHDPGDHRRGDRGGGHRRGRGPLRDDRLRGAAHRQGGTRPLLEAAGGGHHLADPLPGEPQLLRGARHGAPDRGAAALHLLRQHQPDRVAGRHGAAAERRGHRRSAGTGREAASAGDRRRHER